MYKIIGFFILFLCLHSTAIAEQPVNYRETRELLNAINPQNMWDNLTALSQFPNRSSLDPHGVDAANWIKHQLEILIKNSARKDVTVYTVNAYASGEEDLPGIPKQPSIILKIGDSNQPAIVIGAHMDTPPSYTNEDRMPGADDDGSGVVALLEESRVLLNSNIQFQKPVYLVFYAAEEIGLEGSMFVVEDFKKKKIAVDAVMQMDMIGQRHFKNPTLWLGSSRPDDEAPSAPTNSSLLSDKAIMLGKTYLNVPVVESEMDGISDHHSWMRDGIKTILLHDACNANQPGCERYEHTAEDTMDKLSLEHIANYLKLVIAFTVEMAKPVLHYPTNRLQHNVADFPAPPTSVASSQKHS